MNILVRRSGALGDVVLTTPIARRLKRENPDANLDVLTAYPDVFRDNPCVDTAGPHVGCFDEPWSEHLGSYDRFIDLDGAYERRPNLHIISAYMQEAFGDAGDPFERQELFPGKLKTRLGPNAVAVHASMAGWSNRTLPRETWAAVVHGLKKAGFFPILVGTARDRLPNVPATGFYSTDILAQYALITSCQAFVGSDSGLLHVAGATDTPVVGVFTCASPALRMPRRLSRRIVDVPIVTELACAGCLHRRTPPVTTELCEHSERNACVRSITAEEIIAAVQFATAETKTAVS